MKVGAGRCLIIKGFTADEEKQIKELFSIPNLLYAKNKASGRSTWGVPKRLVYAKKVGQTIVCPFGSFWALRKLFPDIKVSSDFNVHPPADFGEVNGIVPRSFQTEALAVTDQHMNGVFHVPTGGGKTILGLLLVLKHKTPTLVVVDSVEIFRQWCSEFEKFTGKKTGQIRGVSFKVDGFDLVVSTSQTLYKRKERLKPYLKKFGMLIIDECQQIGPIGNAAAFVQDGDIVYNNLGSISQWFNASRRYGLTDKAIRSDGQSKCINFALGPLIYETSYDRLVDESCIIKPTMVMRQTDFRPSEKIETPSEQYNDLMVELCLDEKRNQMIVSDLLDQVGHFCLILANRRNYVRLVAGMLIEKNPRLNDSVCVLTASTPDNVRKEYIQKARDGEINYLFCTSLADKGLDIKCLDRLFMIYPGRFEGKKNQQLGRIVRFDEMKEGAIVYEYVDINVGILRSQFIARAKEVYRKRCRLDYDDPILKKLKIVEENKK
jgi:superfamily II DNA or RNA helicase